MNCKYLSFQMVLGDPPWKGWVGQDPQVENHWLWVKALAGLPKDPDKWSFNLSQLLFIVNLLVKNTVLDIVKESFFS